MTGNEKISESTVTMATYLSVFKADKYYAPDELRNLLKLPEGYSQSSRLRTLVMNGRLKKSNKSAGRYSYKITKIGADYLKENKEQVQVIGEYENITKRAYPKTPNPTADMFAIDSLGLSALTNVVKETEAMLSTMKSIHSLLERALAIDEEEEC